MSIVSSSGIIIDDISDHFPIFSSISFDQHHTTDAGKLISIFDYSKLDEMQSFLRTELQGLGNDTNPETIAASIITAYQNGITKFSHTKKLNRQTSARKPWVSPGMLSSINNKNRLYQIKLRYPTEENKLRCVRYRNVLNNVLKCAKKNYFTNEIRNNRNNSKATWNIIFDLIGKRNHSDDSLDGLLGQNGEPASTDAQKAECLNDYFSEVGDKLKEKIRRVNYDPFELVPTVEDEMSLHPTSYEELSIVVTNLNNVGAGVDRINAKIFKGTYKGIFQHILHLYNSCLSTGVFPDSLKIAMIKPIFKSGDPKQLNNYRPISILPFMSKILEKLIFDRMMEHITTNALIHKHQFGF